jgi:hypothetical protein
MTQGQTRSKSFCDKTQDEVETANFQTGQPLDAALPQGGLKRP